MIGRRKKRLFSILVLGIICLSTIFLSYKPLTKEYKTEHELETYSQRRKTDVQQPDSMKRELKKIEKFKAIKQETQPNRDENTVLTSNHSTNRVNNITNHGWSWRLPIVVKNETANFLQEYYDNTTGNWDFKEVTTSGIGSGHQVDTIFAGGKYHLFITNQTMDTSFGAEYFEIQHWTVNYADLEGNRKRTVQPDLQLEYVLAARNESSYDILTFMGLGVQKVWGDTILLSYLLLEQKSNGYTTATLYVRFWNGVEWGTPRNITSTPVSGTDEVTNATYVNVTDVKDLTIYYDEEKNATLASFLAYFRGVQTVTEINVTYAEFDLFLAILPRGSRNFNISCIPIEYPSTAAKFITSEYRVGAPLRYKNTSHSNFSYLPLLKLSENKVTIHLINASLTHDNFTVLATLHEFTVSSLNVRPGPIGGMYFPQEQGISYIPASWVIYFGEDSSSLWLETARVNETDGGVNESIVVQSRYNPSFPTMIGNEVDESFLFYSDLFYGYKEINFLRFNPTDLSTRMNERATTSNTTTIAYDSEFTTSSRLKGSFLLAHIVYKKVNQTTKPVALVTVGFNDTDRDGLGNVEEEQYYKTMGLSPNNPDSDGDRINDGAEIFRYLSNASNVDSDGDNLTDFDEIVEYGTNLTNSDSDGDGLNDYQEVITYADLYFPHPLEKDRDLDSLTDKEEVGNRTACNDSDTDDDTLGDYEEIVDHGTDPTKDDTDGDGLRDDYEIKIYGTNATNNDSDNDKLDDYEEVNAVYDYDTNPMNADTDGDKLNDSEEVFNAYEIDPTDPDTDDDGLSDYAEIVTHQTNPTKRDTDGDGLLDDTEIEIGLNPNDWDTDGDFISDRYEYYIPFLAKTSLYWILAVLFAVVGLFKAWNYGLFKKLEMEAAGMSGEGGTLMFALNREKIEEVVDPNFFASSLAGSFYLIQENLGVEQDYVVMGKRPQVIISKQGSTFLWVQSADVYPKLINKVTQVHKAALDEYADLLDKYGMMPNRLVPVRDFVEERLPIIKREKNDIER
ncbi:MAG: hypothetical protein GWO20_13280 [Candidatus Korarchaeota archaeon]|nr:hypothetical protein [Candidatus Korarchaeota archaeon]NIU84367.1 hypothetical protein [Candidatus Thorarchaeota archaeon]NIW14483.1 hypothetical protein [Candidatus Thorarchaeota archaeon]NIW52560.1 hypothetical protein [Candidatus Korarchaeota archaeon]